MKSQQNRIELVTRPDTNQRIPVLRDLRAPALKDRHWKSISEIVGADLSATSGKKITIEVLDKYSVFEYGHEIARIVKSAMLEEQLDCLISDLRATWTKQRMEMEEVHGIFTKTQDSRNFSKNSSFRQL